MTRIIIVYHSEKGRTEIVAQEVARGVESVPGILVELMKADAVDFERLEAADAIIFGCPTYMGSVPAAMKTFMDASSDVWMRHGWKNKIAGAFTNSYAYSGDKLNVLQQLSIFAMQHGMIWIGVGDMTEGSKPEHINRLGGFLGVMTQSDTSVDETVPPKGDRETAFRYGARVAVLTSQFRRGQP